MRKTVFILTYDENDGYFDHVPPFVAPDPARPQSGRVSKAIDASLEFVTLQQDQAIHHGHSARQSAIGLGYRVPLVIASPWSRGGNVCSEVFDHTSVLRFLEKWLSHATGKEVREPNINAWRRAVCGDLLSSFAPAGDDSKALSPMDRDRFIAQIHRAKFKGLPSYQPIASGDIEALRSEPSSKRVAGLQEPGVRRSCPLPYELFVGGALSADSGELTVRFEARRSLFGERAAGSPFIAYALGDAQRILMPRLRRRAGGDGGGPLVTEGL